MNRVRNFTELSDDEKDEVGLLVSKNLLDPTKWTVEDFPDDSLLRVCKRALRESQQELDVPYMPTVLAHPQMYV